MIKERSRIEIQHYTETPDDAGPAGSEADGRDWVHFEVAEEG